jgi:diadenosine tetraphosphatase ApaH/serine/threonine PP2A family protein phosphatase
MGTAVGARAGDVVCFGHTHLPWHRIVAGVHFINAGSVGRPKDGDSRAGYVLLDIVVSEPSVKAQFVRVEYDVERAVREIGRSGLPNDFANFLRTGGNATAVVDG